MTGWIAEGMGWMQYLLIRKRLSIYSGASDSRNEDFQVNKELHGENRSKKAAIPISENNIRKK